MAGTESDIDLVLPDGCDMVGPGALEELWADAGMLLAITLQQFCNEPQRKRSENANPRDTFLSRPAAPTFFDSEIDLSGNSCRRP